MARPQAKTSGELTILPANKASWEDLEAIFGTRGETYKCQCQHLKIRIRDWSAVPVERRAERLREQTQCDHPRAKASSGLVAYLDGEPVGWCAVEPRTAYIRLIVDMQVPWMGRDEDRNDDSVWAVTCFVIRKGYRGRKLTYALARAAVDFARERGARAIEAYAMIAEPGKIVIWGEMRVGSPGAFAAAGFKEVHKPSKRRVVMRVDF
jgi:GNAT superfamily N-acetyltransferase